MTPPSDPGPKGRRAGGGVPLLRLGLSSALFITCVVVLYLNEPPGPRAAGPATPGALPASVSATADGSVLLPSTESATAESGAPAAIPGAARAFEPSNDTATAHRVVRDMGMLDAVSDYDDVAQNQAYAYLAAEMHHLTDDEAKHVVRADLDYDRLVKAPAQVRGEVVRVLGLLVRFQAIRLARGAWPEGVEDAWRGWIVDTSGDECYVFDMLSAPPAVDMRRDLVEVRGAFLKVLRYDTARGESRDAPFLIAQSVRVVPDEELEAQPHSMDMARYAIIIVGLIAVFALVTSFRQVFGGRASPQGLPLGGLGSMSAHHKQVESERQRLRERRAEEPKKRSDELGP